MLFFKKPTDAVEKLLSEEKFLEDLKQTLISKEKSLGDRKHTLIDDLLKQREVATGNFDEKLAKLGYHANTNQPPSTTPASVVDPGIKVPDDARRVAVDASGQSKACESRIGDHMPDGTIYAGISPDTNKPMYATPADASLTMTFNEAQKYAQGLNTQKAHGHDDWRLPMPSELNALFNNRAAVGGFNVTGSYPAGFYWADSYDNTGTANDKRFSSGTSGYNGKDNHSSVRCVR